MSGLPKLGPPRPWALVQTHRFIRTITDSPKQRKEKRNRSAGYFTPWIENNLQDKLIGVACRFALLDLTFVFSVLRRVPLGGVALVYPIFADEENLDERPS